MTIRQMSEKDWPLIQKIYQDGLDTGLASFEEKAPDWDTWNKKFHKHSRLVAESDNKITGWAGLIPVSERYVYRGVAELSIYIDLDQRGKRIGSALLKAIIESAFKNNIWTIYSSIFPENKASHRLHIAHGFREIGYRDRIAQRLGVWRNTLLLERREERIM